VSDDLAVFAEPVAAALHVDDELPASCARVAILGDGKVGLLIALALHGRGHAVTLVGRHAHKLAIATVAGIATRVAGSLDGLAGTFDAVVEATGNAEGLASALALARPRGTVVLKTTVKDPITIDLAPAVIHELRLVGSRCGDLGRALRALESGAVDPRPLVVARYRLDEAERAFAHASERGVLKVLVDVAAR
jgi:threonine dehydrogenase-like Zn-dependent dehydrogenase